MTVSMRVPPIGPSESHETTALARRNLGLFGQTGILEAIRGATGLSEDQADQVAAGLARIGVALLLPDSADMQGRYANAIALVRDHGYSIRKAATNQVAAKQRWSQGSTERVIDEGMSAIAKLLQGHNVTLSKRDAAMDAIDVTPLDSD